MEFGAGGRIQQLWVTDPTMPDDTEEFQFVCPPIGMGEEVSEDYFPGTILLGARTNPDDPWVLSRNIDATVISDDEGNLNQISFEYEMSFLEELRATARYYEIGGIIPQIAWDLEITNRSRRSVEIGELAFPFALNTVFEGFPRTDRGVGDLYHDRVYVHPFVGGAASYLFAQRMNSRPPGLLVFPGEDTHWEFINHAPASLVTPYRWEGVPIVYIHSRAAIEREGWPEWISGHSSLILEPGESRVYQTRFVSADRHENDNVHTALVGCGRPSIRLFPAAVAPVEVGIAVEVAGATPTRFDTDVEAELETDADENGGFCFVKATEPSSVRLVFEDTSGRESEVHLLLTPPIGELIQARADWILHHQFVTDTEGLQNAITPASIHDAVPLVSPEVFSTPFGIESGLADALFLAEKNTIYPDQEQISALDGYLTNFFEDRVLNPGDHSIGALLPNPNLVASFTGKALLYPMAFCLYDAMARIAEGYGGTAGQATIYREHALALLPAMLESCRLEEANGVPLIAEVSEAIAAYDHHAVDPELLTRAKKALMQREQQVSKRRYPFAGDTIWGTSGFSESFYYAWKRGHAEQIERVLRYAFAARSSAPSWWWYGSDKRWSEEPDVPVHPGLPDKGEVCLGPSTVANSLMLLRTLDRDAGRVDETKLRLAFGGLLGVWGLVRPDGAASMGFCPDASSKQFGMSWTTGDVGLSLYYYLKGATGFVLPSRTAGIQTVGCHFEVENEGGREWYTVRPWDGVGKRIVIRQYGLEAIVSGGIIRELRFDGRKRQATFLIENTSDKGGDLKLDVYGLWGSCFDVNGQRLTSEGGRLRACVKVGPRETVRVEIRVIE